MTGFRNNVKDRRQVPPIVRQGRLMSAWLILLWALAGCVPVMPRVPEPPSSEAAGVLIDPPSEMGPISPYLFGSNYGPWVSLRPETLPLAEEMGIRHLRWPGGAWGDENTVTPLQVDQFVTLARRLGAEPYIHVRFLNSSPDQAAELVRYANLEKGYAIRFWSIGNEPSLYEAMGEGWNAEAFAAEWRAFAGAMKAVDPTIQLLGPEIHQFTGTDDVDPKDSAGRDWLRTFLAANGDLVDIITVHRYPFPNNADRTPALPEELLADSPRWNQIARNLREVVRNETGRDRPIGFTEFNSHWSNAAGGATTPDSFLSALWLGDVLARLIQERVDIANYFLLVSGTAQGHGALTPYTPRPAYYVYRLYRMFGEQQIAATSGEPWVNAVAARRNDGALTVMLINRKDEALTLPLRVEGATELEVEVYRFDNDHLAELVESGRLDFPALIEIPARSMTLLVMQEP